MYTHPNKSLELATLQRDLAQMSAKTKSSGTSRKRRKRHSMSATKVSTLTKKIRELKFERVTRPQNKTQTIRANILNIFLSFLFGFFTHQKPKRGRVRKRGRRKRRRKKKRRN